MRFAFFRGAKGDFDLLVRISFVLDAYCVLWTVSAAQNPRNRQVVATENVAVVENPEIRIRRFLHDRQFFEVPEDWMNVPVDGVQLELSDPTEVTLYKCLFEDHDS